MKEIVKYPVNIIGIYLFQNMVQYSQIDRKGQWRHQDQFYSGSYLNFVSEFYSGIYICIIRPQADHASGRG